MKIYSIIFFIISILLIIIRFGRTTIKSYRKFIKSYLNYNQVDRYSTKSYCGKAGLKMATKDFFL